MLLDDHSIEKEYYLQVTVPADEFSFFDTTGYFMPKVLSQFWQDQHCRYNYVGGSQDGNGKREYSYVINKVRDEEIITIFKILFPKCRVHYYEKGCEGR